MLHTLPGTPSGKPGIGHSNGRTWWVAAGKHFGIFCSQFAADSEEATTYLTRLAKLALKRVYSTTYLKRIV